MEEILTLLNTLNGISPLAIIALLALVLFYQARGNKTATTHSTALNTIKNNDLHELPEIAENIREISATLQRLETSNAGNFATVIARLNGRGST